jgi:hypothetical protein
VSAETWRETILRSVSGVACQEFRMVKSRLGQSLLRLECSLANSRQNEQRADIVLAQWRERWSEHRDRIGQRLELIESQLAQLTGETSHAPPKLSIVGVVYDDEAIRATS